MLIWDKVVKPTLPTFELHGSSSSRLMQSPPQISSDMHVAYPTPIAVDHEALHDGAKRRSTEIDLEVMPLNAKNLFPWTNEMLGCKNECNFFDTRVTACQSDGTLLVN